MGIIGRVIMKTVSASATKTVIRAIGETTVDIIDAAKKSRAEKRENRDDIIIKKGTTYIRPTRSRDDYIDENAIYIAKELLGAGFESVTLIPVKKLNARAVKKYGLVHLISFNGNEEFKKSKHIPSTAQIVIGFLDFKDNVDSSIYNSVNVVRPGRMEFVEDLEIAPKVRVPDCFSTNSTLGASDHIVANAPQQPTKVKSFCPYCGYKIENSNAKFCSSCGNQI